jgi:hypothetical protein
MADTHKTFSFFFFDQKGNHVIYDINRAVESGAEAALASGRRDIFGLSKVLGTCVDLSFVRGVPTACLVTTRPSGFPS